MFQRLASKHHGLCDSKLAEWRSWSAYRHIYKVSYHWDLSNKMENSQGKKSDLNHYHQIFVIPVVSKVFEKIVYEYLNDNKLLSSFRSLHSTLMALLEVTNTCSWSGNIDNRFLNGVVFIHLKKAFDTIDHEIILRKLSYFGADC